MKNVENQNISIHKIHTLVLADTSRWCRLPYRNHEKGCPMFNKRKCCPPQARPINDLIDTSLDMWFIVYTFDIRKYIHNMKFSHPKWSYFQLRNPLYWQGHVKSELKKAAERFTLLHDGTCYFLIPEAHGIFVLLTALLHDIPIEWRMKSEMKFNHHPLYPEETIYKIALVGYKR